MNYGSLLFGNIDEEGKLDDEGLDDELKNYIHQFSTQKDNSDLVRQIIETDYQQQKIESFPQSHKRPDLPYIAPLDNAIDYSDIKEELEECEKPSIQSPSSHKSLQLDLRTDQQVQHNLKKFNAEDFEDFDNLFDEIKTTSLILPPTPPPKDREFESSDLLPELHSFLQSFKQTKNPKFTTLFLASSTTGITQSSMITGKKQKIKRKEDCLNEDINTYELLKLPQNELEIKSRTIPKISLKGSTAFTRPTTTSLQLSMKSHQQQTSLNSMMKNNLEQAKRDQFTRPSHVSKVEHSKDHHPSMLHSFELIHWEDKLEGNFGKDDKISQFFIQRPYLIPHNWDLEKGLWETGIIWDENEVGKKGEPFVNLLLNMNDPYLLFDRVEREDVAKRLSKAERLISKRLRNIRRAQKSGVTITTSLENCTLPPIIGNPVAVFSKPFFDRFNISNDKFYDFPKDPGKASTKGSFEKVALHHSIPALKLTPPHFKCSLSKSELRFFHRPKLSFKVDDFVSFSPLKENKKAKKNREFGEVIKNSKGLTLRDDTSFILFEYSEELPPLISNSGMATILNVYYRKKAQKDPYVPENIEFGIPTPLELGESGPFNNFVDVKIGQEISVVCNNLFRAPCFKNEFPTTDFICVRYTRGSQHIYYIRNCEALYIVGQTFPMAEVYGPHSRRLNLFCRNRVQVAAYRYFQKSDNTRRRLKINILTSLFPQYSEGTIRKWLKEYSESIRQGKDSGYWIMKQTASNLLEEEIRQLVTPEMVCMYESMLAGQQRLFDTGHSTTSLTSFTDAAESDSMNTGDLEDDADQDHLVDDELKITPWNLTHNFIQAAAGKVMLELQGIGDPTGRGEGFSFVKIPLKTQIAYRQTIDVPKRSFSKQNVPFYHRATQADQQIAYKDEIYRIWEAQLKSLSSSEDTQFLDGHSLGIISPSSMDIFSEYSSTIGSTSFSSDDIRSISNNSVLSSIPRKFRGKRLIINRKFRASDGSISTQTETIIDSRIINSYLQQKREKEQIKSASAIMKKRESAMNGSRESIIEKQQEDAPTSVSSLGDSVVEDNLNRPSFSSYLAASPTSHAASASTTAAKKMVKRGENGEKIVTCSLCGQIGHMRTNKSCPLYKSTTSVKAASSFSFPNETVIQKKTASGKILTLKLPKFENTQLTSIQLENENIFDASPLPPESQQSAGSCETLIDTCNGAPVATAKQASNLAKRKRKSSSIIKSANLNYLQVSRRKRPLAEFNQLLDGILTILLNLSDSWPFHRPVNPKHAPNYTSIVHKPMDLGTMKAKCHNLRYQKIEEFLIDLELICTNCIHYNGELHLFSHTAQKMVELAREKIALQSADFSRLEVEVRHEFTKRDNPSQSSSSTKHHRRDSTTTISSSIPPSTLANEEDHYSSSDFIQMDSTEKTQASQDISSLSEEFTGTKQSVNNGEGIVRLNENSQHNSQSSQPPINVEDSELDSQLPTVLQNNNYPTYTHDEEDLSSTDDLIEQRDKEKDRLSDIDVLL